jgi:hypothetical protein
VFSFLCLFFKYYFFPFWERPLGELVVVCHPSNDETGDDKGQAEELTHVERHAGFEVHLVVLDKFDEETHAKQGNEPPAEDAA